MGFTQNLASDVQAGSTFRILPWSEDRLLLASHRTGLLIMLGPPYFGGLQFTSD